MNKEEIAKYISSEFKEDSTLRDCEREFNVDLAVAKVEVPVDVFLLIEFSSVTGLLNAEEIKLLGHNAEFVINQKIIKSRNISLK